MSTDSIAADMGRLQRCFADLSDWLAYSRNVPHLYALQFTWNYRSQLWEIRAHLDTAVYTGEIDQIDAIRSFAGRGGALTLSEPHTSPAGYRYRTLEGCCLWAPYQITVWAHVDQSTIGAPALAGG